MLLLEEVINRVGTESEENRNTNIIQKSHTEATSCPLPMSQLLKHVLLWTPPQPTDAETSGLALCR